MFATILILITGMIRELGEGKLAIVRAKQAREMKPEELVKKISELKLDLIKEQGNVRMGRPIKNPGRIVELRRSIARLLTVKKMNSEKRLKK